MNEDLTPKELARIKSEARSKRIGRIRRRVMLLGATLAAVFSGMVLVRTEINQPTTGASSQPHLVQAAPSESDEGFTTSTSPAPAPAPQPAAPLVTSQS